MTGDLEHLEHEKDNVTLCLDFANTVEWHASDHPQKSLADYGDLLEWSRTRGILDSAEATTLATKTNEDNAFGRETVEEADTLREAIYHIFSSTSHERPLDKKDLETLNAHLAKGMSRARIGVEGGRFRWGWDSEGTPPDMMLWPIAKSAAELLTSERLPQVKECANEEDGCGWLFLDTSRSGNRVWCSMRSCGNRMKFRKYYAKHNKKSAR